MFRRGLAGAEQPGRVVPDGLLLAEHESAENGRTSVVSLVGLFVPVVPFPQLAASKHTFRMQVEYEY